MSDETVERRGLPTVEIISEKEVQVPFVELEMEFGEDFRQVLSETFDIPAEHVTDKLVSFFIRHALKASVLEMILDERKEERDGESHA